VKDEKRIDLKDLFVHPTDYTVLMYRPRGVGIEGTPYFKYYENNCTSGELESVHGFHVCCTENGSDRCRCTFRIDNDKFEHIHPSVGSYFGIPFLPFTYICTRC
jgi:hypothetical protein